MKNQHALDRTLAVRGIPKRFFLSYPQAISALPAASRAIKYSQLKIGALLQMYDFISQVDRNGIPGSIVEMGCGRGGCGAFMAYVSERNRSYRGVWLFDSFEGLSEPTDADWQGNTKDPERVRKGYLAVEQEIAEEAVAVMDLSQPENVHITPGWFEESVPRVKEDVGQIAILRLDADIYEPTKYALEELYDQVSPGGFVVFDDFKNWVGCRRAVYEFFHTHNVAPYLQQYPFGGKTYFQKPDEPSSMGK